MEEDGVDFVINEFLENLERDVVYVKVRKERHVHWWDGWKQEKDSLEDKVTDGIISFHNVDAAMTFIQNNTWPCKTSFQLLFPMLKVEIVSSFMNDEGSKDLSLESQIKTDAEFAYQVEGDIVCKHAARHRQLVEAKKRGTYIDQGEGQEVQIGVHQQEEAHNLSMLSSKDGRAQSELGEGSHKILVSERFDFPLHAEDNVSSKKIEGCCMMHDTLS